VSLPITLRITRGAAPPPEPPGDPDFADLSTNLPSGMTLHTETTFPEDFTNPIPGPAWQDPVSGVYWSIASNRQGEDPTIESDATAPSGTGTVFRQNYAGVADGFEPKFPNTGLGGGLEVFIAMHVKFAESWTNPITSGIKWHILNAMQDGSSQTAGWFGTGREVGGASETINEPNQGWVFNGQCAEMTEEACGIPESEGAVRFQLRPALGTGLMTRGVWHKVQYYMNKNPGTVRIWVDDVAVVDWSGFTWGDPAGGWQTIQMGATWGGGATPNPAPEGTIIYYDRCAIWRR
jgi:hypothetical protein